MVYFSCVASWIHAFRCSTRIPDGLPSLLMQSPLTDTTISAPPGGLSGIATVCTRIGIVLPSGGGVCGFLPSRHISFISPPLWEAVGDHWHYSTIYGLLPRILLAGLFLIVPQHFLPLCLTSVVFTPVMSPGILWSLYRVISSPLDGFVLGLSAVVQVDMSPPVSML